MSGETARAESGWTVDTLHEHVLVLFTERDKAVTAALAAAEKAVNAALDSANRAVLKAETASEKRFESVNEFRKTLSDQTATFLTRHEYGAAHQSLVEKVDDMKVLIAAIQAATIGNKEGREGMSDSVRLGIAVVGAVILIVGFFLGFSR